MASASQGSLGPVQTPSAIPWPSQDPNHFYQPHGNHSQQNIPAAPSVAPSYAQYHERQVAPPSFEGSVTSLHHQQLTAGQPAAPASAYNGAVVGGEQMSQAPAPSHHQHQASLSGTNVPQHVSGPAPSHYSQVDLQGVPYLYNGHPHTDAQYAGMREMQPTAPLSYPTQQSVSGTTPWPSAPGRVRRYARAQQACDNCRSRKTKCNEGEPCGLCKELGIQCVYTDRSDPKPDKLDVIEEKLNYLATSVQRLHETDPEADKLDSIEEKLNDLATSVQRLHETDRGSSRVGKAENHRSETCDLSSQWPSVSQLLPLGDNGDKNTDGTWSTLQDNGILGHTPGTQEQNCEAFDTHDSASCRSSRDLNLNLSTIKMLYESYLENIHCVFPFLDKAYTRDILRTFISTYGVSGDAATWDVSTAPQLKSLSGNDNKTDRAAKRRRTDAGKEHLGNVTIHCGRSGYARSAKIALVWLLLALGALGLHRGPLKRPGCQIMGSCVQHGPDSNFDHQGFPPEDGLGPGLVYYDEAVAAFVHEGDGSGVVHAQVCLCAALFKGCLARPKESMQWTSRAAYICRLLIKENKLYKPASIQDTADFGLLDVEEQQRAWSEMSERTMMEPFKSMILAAWSTMQLESDIVAEMDYPPSGIYEIEETLLQCPQASSEGGFPLFASSSTLYRLRNGWHGQLYKAPPGRDLQVISKCIADHGKELRCWLKSLPDDAIWLNEGKPPTHVADLRLRLNFYEAVQSSNRPYLDYTLHIKPPMDKGKTFDEVAITPTGEPRSEAERLLLRAIGTMKAENIVKGSRACISAACRSAALMEYVRPDNGSWSIDGPRLVLANIHGVAHAQYDNLLMLAAVYINTTDKPLVSSATLQSLLGQIICFMRAFAPLSADILRYAQHLERVQRQLFPAASDTNT